MEENRAAPIQDFIYVIRGHKVLLDRDLAYLYQVEVKALNRAVKRNINRFPDDFMFQLTDKEWENLKNCINLRCQIGTANIENVEKVRYNPYAFTEQGIAMLSGLLSSEIAIDVNIKIMRAFVKLRYFMLSQTGNMAVSSNDQISEMRKLLMLHIENNENKFSEHDAALKQIVKILNNLVEKPKETKKIGFYTGK